MCWYITSTNYVLVYYRYLHDTPLYLPSVPEVTAFFEGNLPTDIASVTNISVIGLFNANHKQGKYLTTLYIQLFSNISFHKKMYQLKLKLTSLNLGPTLC